MIFKDFKIKDIFGVNKKNPVILVYGPNEGLVRDNVNKLCFHFKKHDEAEEITLTEKNLDDEPNKIFDEIDTISMFNNKKIIFIESLKDKHVPLIEKLFESILENILVILKSDSLGKSSKLRKLFDTSEIHISIPCYEDDMKSIMNLVQDFEKKFNLQLERDVKNYLAHFLSNDRLISKSELEKIFLLQGNKSSPLSLHEVQAILNDVSSISLNKINESVMFGKTKATSKIIHKIFSEGIHSVALIRSLINYTMRIQLTQIELKKHKSFDEAIKILRPPVFWKEKNSFQNHCAVWPMQHIEKNLKVLLDAEYDCKSSGSLSNSICERYILTIANEGKKYFPA